MERYIKRVLRVRKRFPDFEDATEIIRLVREMDSLLTAVSAKAVKFSKEVRTF